MSKPLPSVREREDALVAKLKRKEAERVQKLYGYILSAADVDDEGAVPEEWKKSPQWQRRFRVAQDARKSKRNAPYYLDAVVRKVEAADRADLANQVPQLQQLNIGTVNIVQAPRYEELAIDVESKLLGDK